MHLFFQSAKSPNTGNIWDGAHMPAAPTSVSSYHVDQIVACHMAEPTGDRH